MEPGLYLDIYIYFWLFVFGTCIGSFLNVVIDRLPKGVFFSNQRSYCPLCGETLSWRDVLPIISYFILKGRCRFCGGHISIKYPLVEVSLGLSALVCRACFGFSFEAAMAYGILAVLTAVALIDADTMIIPDQLVIALAVFAIADVWVSAGVTLPERVIGFFAISLPMLILTLMIPSAFGGGDIKLMAVCGFLLGWKGVLLAFFAALLTGGSQALFLMLTGKGKTGAYMPFGPHLCFGVALDLLAGQRIIEWYWNSFAAY